MGPYKGETTKPSAKYAHLCYKFREYKNGENVNRDNYKPGFCGGRYDLWPVDLKNKALRRSLWI